MLLIFDQSPNYSFHEIRFFVVYLFIALFTLTGCSDESIIVKSDSESPVEHTQSNDIISASTANLIMSSPEYQRVIDLNREVMTLIKEGLESGKKPEMFALAIKNDLDFSDDKTSGKRQHKPSLKYVLFEDSVEASNWEIAFIRKAKNAHLALREKHPEFATLMDSVGKSNNCNVTPEHVDKIFETIQVNMARMHKDDWDVWDYLFPKCGSWGARIKFAACATLCSTGGLFHPAAIAACTWGCFCGFCKANPYHDILC